MNLLHELLKRAAAPSYTKGRGDVADRLITVVDACKHLVPC